MRIGIDIDDTICDTYETILPYICRYYKVDYEQTKKENTSLDYFLSIDADGYYKFARAVYKYIIPKVPVYKHAQRYLNRLKKKGYEIIFITARNQVCYENAYQLTYDYLVKNGVPFDTLITGSSDKATVCVDEDIDVFIDDDIKNCEAVSAKGITTVLYQNVYNKNYKNKSIYRAKNWRQLYKRIKGGKYGRR